MKDITLKGEHHCGVYSIICEIAKSVYIGQSANIRARLIQHRCNMINNEGREYIYVKMNWHLFEYGISAFKYKIEEYVYDRNDMLAKEKEWMQRYVDNGYKLYNEATYVNYV